ncbi:MAG: hypothetical protein N3G20_00105 [Verrucomicrobiae bacterium]|nr:hypothetical protein [Verrucomicrobiae bacterium]
MRVFIGRVVLLYVWRLIWGLAGARGGLFEFRDVAGLGCTVFPFPRCEYDRATISVMAGLYKPDAREIFWPGHPFWCDPQDLTRLMGMFLRNW